MNHLATNADLVLYEAEIDHGYAFRCYRLAVLCLFTPWGLLYLASKGCSKLCKALSCDEACCWVRKEYSTRTFFRVYPNRIVYNHPAVRKPWGFFGYVERRISLLCPRLQLISSKSLGVDVFSLCRCGSWNADKIETNHFDRGAFGFSVQNCGSLAYLCCTWPVYGGTIVRHRCQCNGPVWNRMLTDCGGCWCDEW
jgi:hypothetical protein